MFGSIHIRALSAGLILIQAAGGQQVPTASGDTPKSQTVSRNYVLGAGDEINVFVRDVEEINKKPLRVENDGYISVPLAGRVMAAGLTAPQLETALIAKLKAQILDPQVSVAVAEFRSQPVSIIGAVNKPGVIQVQGRKTLVEVLSLAEGLRTDAGRMITVTRRLEHGRIPLPGATDDPSGQYSMARIDMKTGLLDGLNPEQNIAIQPDDVISVPKADMIYVIGEVKRSGGFVLNDRETLSVLQAIAMAEGLTLTAASKDSKILRTKDGSPNKIEIPIDLKQLLAGKGEDLRLQPNDIVFVPNNRTRNFALKTLETAVQIGTGVAIYRR